MKPTSPKIIVDSPDAKAKLYEIARLTEASMKDVVIRLVEKEHKRLQKNK